ncbi:nitroreductase family protein [Bifidobacterium simiiventris]|uniref:nitroreductase family protein n=1 Tax=Bifidobacterium simiiventris TaxID=2834434 RepID=UPI001C55F579|nr:nitroreductase family protein [Bifidobacterium simiiventris]MBW3077650.1 nitroreductase [Bifidobacterium simiiventris]
MDIIEAMGARHAVREYTDQPLDENVLKALSEAIGRANADGGLDIQLVHDNEDAFGGCPTHYGRFRNVRYCLALIGRDTDASGEALDERAGYFGERLALEAVRLGLDTGWVVLHETTGHHGRWHMGDGERMPAAIALGHGARAGRPHRSKPIEELGMLADCDATSTSSSQSDALTGAPDWFVNGLKAVQLAPSALGKQPFRFVLLDDARHAVRAEALDGVQAHIGLGIAKLHFELGAGVQVLWE